MSEDKKSKDMNKDLVPVVVDNFPYNYAFELLNNNEIDEVKFRLGLTELNCTGRELFDAVFNLKNAFKNTVEGDFESANTNLQKCIEVFQVTQNRDVYDFVYFLVNLTLGIRSLYAGDGYAALNHFNNLDPLINEAATYGEGLQNSFKLFKGINFIVLARIETFAGNELASDQYIEKFNSIADNILKNIDFSNNQDLNAKMVAHQTKLELLNFKAFSNLILLDTEKVTHNFKDSVEDVKELKNIESHLDVTINTNMLKSAIKIHEMLNIALKVVKSYTSNKYLNKEDLLSLQEFKKIKYSTEKLCLSAGTLGKGNLSLINQLNRFVENLVTIGKISKRDFTFGSSISFLGSFILLLIIIKFIINPGALGFALYFLGDIIISLIVGFGYGAIRYIPLLKLYTSIINKQEYKA